VVKVGARTFNGGEYEACYRIYQGALLALGSRIEGKAQLKQKVDDLVAKAQAMRDPSDRAFALREALEAIYSAHGGAVAKKATLWDRLGGERAVRAVVHDFVISAAPDPKVNFDRNGKYKLTPDDVRALEQKLVELVSAVSGGPLKYSGKSMKEAHEGMGITNEEFNALADHLVATLKKFNVPQKEINELVGIVASTRGDIVEAKSVTPKPKKERALWDRLGGEKAVRAVVHDFVLAAAPDPKVNFDRNGKYKLTADDVKKLEQKLVELVSAVSGGPLKYSGKSMKEAHEGMKITNDEFDALAFHLIATLKKYNVPQKEIDELVSIVASTRGDIVEVKDKK
jgi:hemoglobin